MPLSQTASAHSAAIDPSRMRLMLAHTIRPWEQKTMQNAEYAFCDATATLPCCELLSDNSAELRRRVAVYEEWVVMPAPSCPADPEMPHVLHETLAKIQVRGCVVAAKLTYEDRNRLGQVAERLWPFHSLIGIYV